MKVLLIGASSYVGARLYFDLQSSHNIIGTYKNSSLFSRFIKLDITNKEDVNNIINYYKPDWIIHAAANADARWCEANPKVAVLLNEKATSHIVSAANKINSN